MDDAEFWVLDAASDALTPVHWLSAHNADELLNRAHHNLPKPDLLAVLNRMFERGDLFLKYVRGDVERYVQSPSPDEIEAALYPSFAMSPEREVWKEWLAEPERVFYGMTAAGAAKWEARANPRWDEFFDIGYEIDPYQGRLEAANRQVAEVQLARAANDSMVEAIVPESIRWTVLEPWNATYWKQLPIGYRVTFSYVPRTERRA